MKKHKIFKTLGFASLAVLMGFGATMAFAPLGNVAPISLATSQPTDVLVTPKEDDPVLFTTEDGLEIKWGNAASLQGGGKETWSASKYTTYASAQSGIGSSAATNITNQQTLTSGNLSGFPYFTTTSGSTTYTWVIIGRNSNVTNGLHSSMNIANISSSKSSAKIEYKTLNDWKAKIGNADTYDNFVAGYSPTYKSFFNNTYETTSPAGAAINNNGLLSAVTARNYSASASWTYTDSWKKISAVSAVKTNAEIPSGCVLVLCNGIVGSTSYNTSIGGGDLQSLYSLSSLGIANLNIQTVSVSRRQWDNSTYTFNAKIFNLGAVRSSFHYGNYLTSAQVKLSSNVWTGDSYSGYVAGYLNTSGGLSTGSGTYGQRPAFVLKVT